MQYSTSGAFNADEFGLFFKSSPKYSIGTSILARRKEEGSCFNGKTGCELGLLYFLIQILDEYLYFLRGSMNLILRLDRKEIENRLCLSTRGHVKVRMKNCQIFQILKLFLYLRQRPPSCNPWIQECMQL